MKSKPKTAQQVRKAGTNAALAGDNVFSFSASLKGKLKTLVSETLPKDKYVLASDFCAVVSLIVKKLLEMLSDAHIVVIDRATAERVILSAVAIHAPTTALPGIEPATEEVRAMERRYQAAAVELTTLNQKLTSDPMSFEQFVEECNKLRHSTEVASLLRVAETAGEMDFYSQAGKIELAECKRKLKHLHSQSAHRYVVTVTGVNDSPTGIAVATLDVSKRVSPGESTVPSYRRLVANLIDPEQRRKFLLAQLDCLEIEVTATLNRVPIVFDPRGAMEIDIVDITWLP